MKTRMAGVLRSLDNVKTFSTISQFYSRFVLSGSIVLCKHLSKIVDHIILQFQ